jgi:hypothetical protein
MLVLEMGGFMKCTIGTGKFQTIGSGIRKLFGGGGGCTHVRTHTHTHTHTHRKQGDLVSLVLFFQHKGRRLVCTCPTVRENMSELH